MAKDNIRKRISELRPKALDVIIGEAKVTDGFYVYLLFDGNIPFYVGKGRGERIKMHEKMAKNTSRGCNLPRIDKIRSIWSSGKTVGYAIFGFFDTEIKAYDCEKNVVDVLGRRSEGGPLLNLTAGGTGVFSPTQETRLKMRLAKLGKPRSEDAVRKTAEGNRGKKRTEEMRARLSRGQRGCKKPGGGAASRRRILAAMVDPDHVKLSVEGFLAIGGHFTRNGNRISPGRPFGMNPGIQVSFPKDALTLGDVVAIAKTMGKNITYPSILKACINNLIPHDTQPDTGIFYIKRSHMDAIVDVYSMTVQDVMAAGGKIVITLNDGATIVRRRRGTPR